LLIVALIIDLRLLSCKVCERKNKHFLYPISHKLFIVSFYFYLQPHIVIFKHILKNTIFESLEILLEF